MTMQRLRLKAANYSFSNTWEGAVLFAHARPKAGGYLVQFPHPVGNVGADTQWFYSTAQVELLPALTRSQKDRYTIANGVWAKVVSVDVPELIERDIELCAGCAFEGKATCATAPPCSKAIRADKQDIIFITDIAKQITT